VARHETDATPALDQDRGSLTSASLDVGDRVVAFVRHPDMGPVEGHGDRDEEAIGATREGLHQGTVAGVELGHRGAIPVRHPHMGPVEGDAVWIVEAVGAARDGLHEGTVAGVELGDRREWDSLC